MITPLANTFLIQTRLLGADPAMWKVLAYDVTLIAVAFLGFVSTFALLGIWAERKVSALMQSRLGPNRVGPIGLFQSIADGIKLITKEDLAPAAADKWLFRLAPYLAFVPAFAVFVALPFGPEMVFEPRFNAGAFWVLAMLGVEVIGIIIAGWASNNKWSVFGAMREACQMVSYEVPLGLSIVTVVAATGSLNLVHLSELQSGGMHTWLAFRSPFLLVAFVIFFVASLAANKRAPFDLPESDSELVAGYHTEYSGLRFSLFYFAEYAAMFVVSAVAVTLFLGGWNDPIGLIGKYHREWTLAGKTDWLIGLNVIAANLYIGKCVTLVLVQMWLRWTLPRPRIDQVLYACFKVLLPFALLMLAGQAIWSTYVPQRIGVPWVDYQPWDVREWRGGMLFALVASALLAGGAIVSSGLLTAWVGYAFMTGRRKLKRLSELT